jgi:hypothetical protein
VALVVIATSGPSAVFIHLALHCMQILVRGTGTAWPIRTTSMHY